LAFGLLGGAATETATFVIEEKAFGRDGGPALGGCFSYRDWHLESVLKAFR